MKTTIHNKEGLIREARSFADALENDNEKCSDNRLDSFILTLRRYQAKRRKIRYKNR